MDMKDFAMLIFGIVLGVGVLLSIASNLLITQQSTANIINETITSSAYNSTDSLNYPNVVVGSEIVKNATSDAAGLPTTLRLGSEYRMDYVKGMITLNNRTGSFFITYDYYPPAYVNGLSKTIYNGMMPLLAVGVLIYIAYLALRKQ